MAPDIYDRAHGLAVACLQHEEIAKWVLNDIKFGDADAFGKRLGQFERAILNELMKPVEPK